MSINRSEGRGQEGSPDTRELSAEAKFEKFNTLIINIEELAETMASLNKPEYNNLLKGTHLEPAKMHGMIKELSEYLRKSLDGHFIKQLSEASEEKARTTIAENFIKFMLQGNNMTTFTHILRFQQTLEAYCRPHTDVDVQSLYKESAPFRDNLTQLKSTFKDLDVYFDPVEYLTNPDEHGYNKKSPQLGQPKENAQYSFDEIPSAPSIKSAWTLIKDKAEKAETNRQVADVSKWGVSTPKIKDCSSDTTLWRWWA